ncbi:putative quinol monooxygenase [Pseudonocardia sp. NPDC049154]|uniref:putative quinol monooxygenase n=1 Tax=Pseudonocardia sp. NPDC049154 TaxID=3155501 RepID=UPI0033C76836
MSPVIVVATISPKPGEEQAVREAFLAAIPKVHDEAGCGKYALHESTGDSTDLVFVERWESAEALKTHSTAPALAEVGKALKGRLAGPIDVKTFTPIPAGTTEQGTI